MLPLMAKVSVALALKPGNSRDQILILDYGFAAVFFGFDLMLLTHIETAVKSRYIQQQGM